MVHVLARNWWALLIRGIAAVIFGILAFLWPGITLVVIGILFGAYAFVDGVFAIVAAVRAAQSHERWWPFVLEGIVGFVIAAITFYDVGITLSRSTSRSPHGRFSPAFSRSSPRSNCEKRLRTNGCSSSQASVRCSSAF